MELTDFEMWSEGLVDDTAGVDLAGGGLSGFFD